MMSHVDAIRLLFKSDNLKEIKFQKSKGNATREVQKKQFIKICSYLFKLPDEKKCSKE